MYVNHITHYWEISKYQMHMVDRYHPPFPPSHPFNVYQNVHLYIFGAESENSYFDSIRYMTQSIKTQSKYRVRIMGFGIFSICYAISSEAKVPVLRRAAYCRCKGNNCNNALQDLCNHDMIKRKFNKKTFFYRNFLLFVLLLSSVKTYPHADAKQRKTKKWP
jgi:hypothetical protein